MSYLLGLPEEKQDRIGRPSAVYVFNDYLKTLK